jgi:hypothetical protein
MSWGSDFVWCKAATAYSEILEIQHSQDQAAAAVTTAIATTAATTAGTDTAVQQQKHSKVLSFSKYVARPSCAVIPGCLMLHRDFQTIHKNLRRKSQWLRAGEKALRRYDMNYPKWMWTAKHEDTFTDVPEYTATRDHIAQACSNMMLQ